MKLLGVAFGHVGFPPTQHALGRPMPGVGRVVAAHDLRPFGGQRRVKGLSRLQLAPASGAAPGATLNFEVNHLETHERLDEEPCQTGGAGAAEWYAKAPRRSRH